LNIAVGFTSFSSETEWELDPTYGTLEFNSFSWGTDEDGKPFTERKALHTHVCTKGELNADGVSPDATFYAPNAGSLGFI